MTVFKNCYEGYKLNQDSIVLNAPEGSGIYGLFSALWIFVGEADNIQARLLQHLTENEPVSGSINPRASRLNWSRRMNGNNEWTAPSGRPNHLCNIGAAYVVQEPTASLTSGLSSVSYLARKTGACCEDSAAPPRFS